MKDVTEIVRDLVDSLDFMFNAETSEVVQHKGKDAYKLSSCNTYWITDCTKVTINIAGTDYVYKVVDLMVDEYITLQPTLESSPPVPTGDLFPIGKPTFRHGTARAVNTELTKIQQKDKRLFLWLYGVVTEDHIVDTSSLHQRESPVKMFVFAEANSKDWWTEDHYAKVIRPLKSIFVEMRKKIDKSDQFGRPENFSETNLPDWGEFNDIKGFEGKILDEDWSGIQGKTLLKIINKCKNC